MKKQKGTEPVQVKELGDQKANKTLVVTTEAAGAAGRGRRRQHSNAARGKAQVSPGSADIGDRTSLIRFCVCEHTIK